MKNGTEGLAKPMSDDLISRSALQKKINNSIKRITRIERDRDMFFHDSGWNGAIARARLEIDNAPAVDAVPVVHGRWVMKETMIKSPFAKNAFCSECLEETGQAYNFCPSCGAKMDGGKANETV